MASSWEKILRDLNSVVDEMSSEAQLLKAAEVSAKIVDQSVQHTLGDQSMSGWRRGAPIETGGRATVTPLGVAIEPSTKGPMRVLESGRHMGNASGFAGPGISARTGLTSRNKSGAVRKVRARKGGRWNGYTRPRHTWSTAESLIRVEFPRAEMVELTRTMGKYFTRG